MEQNQPETHPEVTLTLEGVTEVAKNLARFLGVILLDLAMVHVHNIAGHDQTHTAQLTAAINGDDWTYMAGRVLARGIQDFLPKYEAAPHSMDAFRFLNSIAVTLVEDADARLKQGGAAAPNSTDGESAPATSHEKEI